MLDPNRHSEHRAGLVTLLEKTEAPQTMSAAESMPVDYLAAVFETWLDAMFPCQGFILFSPNGEPIRSSPYARKLCQAMQQERGEDQLSRIPSHIAHLTRCLIESRQLFPENRIQLQDEVLLEDNSRVHIQAEWITLAAQQWSCILINLKNLSEAAYQQAATDARRYHFTDREEEIWAHLLLGLSNVEIGQELFISVNTVKQHRKSIRRKQSD